MAGSAASAWCVALGVAVLAGASLAQVSENLLKNPSFEEGVADNGLPVGWSQYAGGGQDQAIRLVTPADTGDNAVLIQDGDPGTEIGLTQTVQVEPDLVYQASVMVKGVPDATSAGSYIQLRFLPSNEYHQKGLAAPSTEMFTEVAVKGVAPPDTERAVIYLYSHRGPVPRVIVDSAALVSGVEPPPPPPPEPVPPQYDKLKELHLTTELVKDGQPNVTIIKPAGGAYDGQAEAIQGAISELTGVRVPIVTDEALEGEAAVQGHLILLGNRSTNNLIGGFYDAFYTLLDLKYPGPNGYVVRTLHNPFGDGRNVIFVGGSDANGVAGAAEAFVGKLREAGGKQGSLSVGRLAEIKLGDGITVPHDVNELKIWEASAGYRSTGYFGWCSISKRAAAYYMTGDEFHAREFIRLAFPDAQALQDISEIDGERIENKDDPLAGFYHYNAHMAILFWDLIEESPVFTDEERLKVTNAFARQLNHRKGEGIYGRTSPPGAVGTRHGQWSAVSLYCLGRYFGKYYPDPIWAHCVESAKLHFAPLHEHSYVGGESDNLFWYNTGIAPIFTHMVLTGDRKPLENGVLQTLLRGQEMLISGRVPDGALNSASMGFLHKAAYLTQDGRWVGYRDRTGVDLDVFRLGQSFWPEEHLQPEPPADLVGRWTLQRLPVPKWGSRGSGLPFEQSFEFGSYRSAADASGDFILIDGFNGASRNPYHTFAVLELRLGGATLLKGYHNQVMTRADGMVEPQIAMDAALPHHDVLGDSIVAVGEVPRAAFCNWRRSLVQRAGRYALFVDDLAFRTDSENIEVQTLWETASAEWDAEANALRLRAQGGPDVPPGWRLVRALDVECASQPAGEDELRPLDSLGIMLLRATEPGAWLEMAFTLDEPVAGDVFAEFLNYTDRGTVRMSLDGNPAGEEYEHHAAGVARGRTALGKHELAAGEHRLRVEVVAPHGDTARCYIGLVGLSIRPEGAPAADAAAEFAVCPSDPVRAMRRGAATTMEWTGAAKEGEHRVFFSLLGGREGEIACFRVAENAAALALPSAAVAAIGECEGLNAELAVLAADHLYAHRLSTADLGATLLRADKPVDVDWDFESGRLHIAAAEDTQLAVGLAAAGKVTLNGAAADVSPGPNGLVALGLPAGRHVVEGAEPPPASRQAVQARLVGLLAAGRQQREQLVAAAQATQPQALPELQAAMAASIEGAVADLITFETDAGPVIAAAEGSNVRLLRPPDGDVQIFAADGPVRMVRWWPEHKLLLAGCADEQVIAFGLDGRRKWVFTSEMHPDVFRAAKTYWFKSAPGHEGIHGLTTGVFLDGKSQAFVGSACTLEIIDERGELIDRLTQFWGKVSHFAFIDGPEGSINLLASRKYNGGNTVAIINNKTLDSRPRGFHTVPSGHTYVPGWSSMNRHHLFYEDLDGDGVKEVISEINGTWNRVTVWDAAGKALYDASFGPGDRIPAKNMRDLDIADLDGDGKKEILAATSSGLVVALDYQCRKVWSRRLASAPTVMKAVTPPGADTPWIVVGCQDGSVVVLDGTGEPIRSGQVTGFPNCIEAISIDAQPVVLLATNKGEVKGFEVGE